ncbi:MAG: hypothetical protein LBE62_13060 [Azonexus sp.]|jgi:hypothetical protein|nr:hypothetical protein [Azonexus sp.]
MNHRLRQILIALDQFLNTLLGGWADETVSARAHRNGWKRTERFINWLFRDPEHCRASYESELARSQLPRAYRPP